jgi:3-dehydroquinate dehydratase-1
MSALRIGTFRLRPQHPTVIVPITDRTPARHIVLASGIGVDLVEARVDLFRKRTPAAAAEFIGAVRKSLPVLVTIRSADEGGAWRATEEERLELYRGLMPSADAVDVELGATIRPAVVRAAHRAGLPVVLSHHDFRRTPPDAELERIVSRGFRAGADIVKIAAHVRDDRDTTRLAGLLARHVDRALCVIGMGEHGVKTRVLFPALGSLFTFGALGRATAPGQLPLVALLRELTLHYPGFAPRSRVLTRSRRKRNF